MMPRITLVALTSITSSIILMVAAYAVVVVSCAAVCLGPLGKGSGAARLPSESHASHEPRANATHPASGTFTSVDLTQTYFALYRR
jgi:hypothetical protein